MVRLKQKSLCAWVTLKCVLAAAEM